MILLRDTNQFNDYVSSAWHIVPIIVEKKLPSPFLTIYGHFCKKYFPILFKQSSLEDSFWDTMAHSL